MKTRLLFISLIAFVLLIGLSFLQTSCSSKEKNAKDSIETRSPKVIAKNFLNYMNDNQPEEAKKLATPSAIECIEKLNRLGAFESDNKWKESIQIMDVIASTSNEGDSAIVNYSIGELKNAITLVVSELEWKVTYSYKLNSSKIIEATGYSFLKKITDANRKDYTGTRWRLKNLLFNSTSFYGYDPSSFSTSQEKDDWMTKATVSYNGKLLNYSQNFTCEAIGCNYSESISKFDRSIFTESTSTYYTRNFTALVNFEATISNSSGSPYVKDISNVAKPSSATSTSESTSSSESNSSSEGRSFTIDTTRSNGSQTLIIIVIIAATVILGGGAFLIIRKKKTAKLKSGQQPLRIFDQKSPPPPVEQKTTVPPPAMEKPVVSYCTDCGTAIGINEKYCENCETKLNAKVQKPEETPPPPKIEISVIPATEQVVTNDNQKPFTPEPVIVTAAPVKKKGSKKLLWIIIIVVGIVIIGGGTVAFLQYKGTVNIPFLSGLIPSTSSSEQPAVVTNYYVVHSFASTGSGKWEAIVSAVFSTQTAYNNEEGAKNAFKKAVMKKYPKDSNLFTNSVLCVSYNSLPEAQSGRSGLLKNYTNKKYDVRSVDVIY